MSCPSNIKVSTSALISSSVKPTPLSSWSEAKHYSHFPPLHSLHCLLPKPPSSLSSHIYYTSPLPTSPSPHPLPPLHPPPPSPSSPTHTLASSKMSMKSKCFLFVPLSTSSPVLCGEKRTARLPLHMGPHVSPSSPPVWPSSSG